MRNHTSGRSRSGLSKSGQSSERIQSHFESKRGIVVEGKYSVELFKEGGEGVGMEEIVDRHDNLTVARAIYRGRVSQYPGRLVKLRDRARVLARSDRPETMP